MTTIIRESPSGPIVGDFGSTTDDVDNQSEVPDALTVTDALNRLASGYSTVFNEDFTTGRNTTASGSGLQILGGFGQKNWTNVKNDLLASGRATTAGGGTVIGNYNLGGTTVYSTMVLGGFPLGPGTGMRIDRYDYLYWRMFPNSAASVFGSSRCGLGSDPRANVAPAMGQNALWFEKVHNPSNAAWTVNARRNNGSPTQLVAFNTATGYVDLEMFRSEDTGHWTFRINDVDVVGAILSTQLPAGTVTPIGMQAGANCAIELCTFHYTRR